MKRVSRSSREFEDLREKFEKQDIGNYMPHSQNFITFRDIFPGKDE